MNPRIGRIRRAGQKTRRPNRPASREIAPKLQYEAMRDFAGPVLALLSLCWLAACDDLRVDPVVRAGVTPSPPTPANCPDKLVGYGTQGDGTTGGSDGPQVVAHSLDELKSYAEQTDPVQILIDGRIELSDPVRPKSDKTIIGVGKAAMLHGAGLFFTGVHNVIVQNLAISHAAGDAIGIQSSDHIWIDHCELFSELEDPDGLYDGLADIKHASDFITLSWNYLHDHQDVSLVGHSDNNAAEDTGFLHVTYHHNFFAHTRFGNPRVRYGRAHIFNNRYLDIQTNAVISAMRAEVLVEANVFEQVTIPATTHYEDPEDGYLNFVGNSVSSDSGPNDPLNPISDWTSDYAYDADSTDAVAFLVPACAGVGKLDE